jgi:uncharacterized protein (DUF433 family)
MTDIAVDMGREMARHVDAGSSSDEIDAAMLKAFPTATAADMQRALQIGLDQMKMWEDEREEAVRKVAELLFNGGTDAEIKAAIERTKLSAETLFPKPDKAKS